MQLQDLEMAIEKLALRYKLRAKRGYSDEKRHDRVRKDEVKAMLKAEEKFGLTPPKIAEVFNRDVRTVARKLEEAKQEERKGREPPLSVMTKRAQLQIEFDPGRLSELGLIYYTHSPLVRKFARISVNNVGEATAVRSWGILKILAPKESLDRYPRDLKLHWVDTPYGLEVDSAQPVDIQIGAHKLLDVVFSQPWKKDAPTLLEPTFGQALTSGHPDSVIVGNVETAEWGQPFPNEGCWIANAIALTNPCVTTPGYIPPGHCIVEVMVSCENGQGDTKCFEIISPSDWRDLQMIPVPLSQAP